jgi:mannose-6-phosphate isomerase-like protein (cupin superfamily)
MHVRRVVTGQQPDGRSVFVSDEPVAPVEVAGLEFHAIWGSDERVRLPTDGKTALPRMWFPPPGGFRFAFFTVPPDAGVPRDAAGREAMLSQMRSRLPGLVEVLEPDHPGMHTTDTVDFDLVVSGEVWLELDDGAEVLLRAGDCVVQNGTRHRWRNRSAAPCVLAVALVGGVRTKG